MKAISLTQPWATLVAIGAKRIETRSCETLYRGPLAIHAAKGMPDSAMDTCQEEPFRTVLLKAGIAGVCDLPRGAVIAICRLVGCLPVEIVSPSEQERAFGDYGPGRWAWILDDIRVPPDPIPAKGALGLWEWEPSTDDGCFDPGAALAGLDPGDVATLVGLVRRFAELDDGDQPFCWRHAELWAEANELVEYYHPFIAQNRRERCLAQDECAVLAREDAETQS